MPSENPLNQSVPGSLIEETVKKAAEDSKKLTEEVQDAVQDPTRLAKEKELLEKIIKGARAFLKGIQAMKDRKQSEHDNPTTGEERRTILKNQLDTLKKYEQKVTSSIKEYENIYARSAAKKQYVSVPDMRKIFNVLQPGNTEKHRKIFAPEFWK